MLLGALLVLAIWVGSVYARRGFRLTPGQRCGDHGVRRYLGQVNALKRQFAIQT